MTFRDRDTKEWKNAQKKVIADAKIVFSTLSLTGNKKFEGLDFDYLIVDEACQSNELETLIAM